MLGKLIEIHPRDGFYGDREVLIGSIWELDGVPVWTVEDSSDESVVGYSHSRVFYRGNARKIENYLDEYSEDKSLYFFAVKFETIENLENN